MHVLIVDDNVGFSRLLRNQLVPDGFRVSATNDPAGARASALANQPNVLVVDADLPRGGAEVALEGICQVLKAPAHTFLLTERSPEKPDIVALAAHFGASEVLVRPIPMLQFAEMITAVLESEPGTVPSPSAAPAERPLAPWEADPNWGMERPELKVRTSKPVHDDPTLPRLDLLSDEAVGEALLPPEPRLRHDPAAQEAQEAQADEEPLQEEAPLHELAPPPKFETPEMPLEFSKPSFQTFDEEPVVSPPQPPPKLAVVAPPPPTPPAGPRVVRAEPERPRAPWEDDPDWGKSDEAPQPPKRKKKKKRPRPQPSVVLDEPVVDTGPVIQRPRVLNVGILQTLTKIWARRHSGTLRAENHPGTALFADGAPADVMSEIFAKEALESTLELTFSENRSEPNTRRENFTDILWGAAKELAEPQFVRIYGSKALEDCAWPAALDELPVAKEIKRVAAASDGYISLADLLDAIGVGGLPRIGLELSALEAMGIVKFAPVREAKVVRPVLLRKPEPLPEPDAVEEAATRRSGRLRMEDDLADAELAAAGLTPDETPTLRDVSIDKEPTLDAPARPRGRRKRPSMRGEMELKRLRREKEHLERSDEWTVLGIPPTEDRSMVKAAAARMKQRYQDIAADEELSEEARRLASDIAGMVGRAAEMARPPTDNPMQSSREDQAFGAGRKAMAGKDWDSAVRCFRTAYKADLNNAEFMGYYGWSMWRLAESKNDAESAKLREDGIEMMRLSDQFDNGNDHIQLFLASAEREKGELARAEARCNRILKRDEDFPGVAMLLAEITRAKAAKS